MGAQNSLVLAIHTRPGSAIEWSASLVMHGDHLDITYGHQLHANSEKNFNSRTGELLRRMSSPLTNGVVLIDLKHLDREGAIAAGLIKTQSGAILIDPGPSSTLGTLCEQLANCGIRITEIEAILLTHIHLDHAGAAGSLVQKNPSAKVYVHRRGVANLSSPERLLQSATRVFGAEMQRLWGGVLPLPLDKIVPLDGGERLTLANRRIEVLYTPGHAWHHATYYDPFSGIAFAGDATGNRDESQLYVLPTTPPPDIDLEAWRISLAAIRELAPESLFITHFGVVGDVPGHLEQFWSRIQEWSERVRHSLCDERSDEARAREFAESVAAQFPEDFARSRIAEYMRGPDLETSWYGLARYWRKQKQTQ